MPQISEQKLRKIAFLAFNNSLRLHFDSILLFKNDSYSTAFHISVLATEETGKAFWIVDYLWNSEFGSGRTQKLDHKFLKLLYHHVEKQKAFLGRDYEPHSKEFREFVESGLLESKKQNSIYVGLPRKGQEIDLKGEIKTPKEISFEDAKRQIGKLNNHIYLLTEGVIGGYRTIDDEKIEAKLNNKLLIKLQDWEDSYG